ncbi:MAG: hypothetical protein MK078_18200 [Crocinitomicaceae bacterium]|nr:hypothetical protein [Crocinitomicaceae bacterium]MCH2236170.1 hypothetical protein [Crocinitomicaceae bacterium]
MKSAFFILFVFLFGLNAKAQESDTSEVKIDVLIMISGMETVYSPCDSTPKLYLFEDDRLIYTKQFDSLNQTFDLSWDEQRLVKVNHLYKIVISDKDPKGQISQVDEFTTYGITNHTRIIRNCRFMPVCLMGREYSQFHFNNDSLADICDFKWLLRDINIRDSAKIEIQYFSNSGTDKFEERKDYLKSVLVEMNYREDQFWFVRKETEEDEDFIELLLYSM